MLLARNTRRRFADVSQRSGKVFHQAWVASGMAIGDLDDDGRLDAVVTTNDGPVHILHNETPSRNHWIRRRSLGSDANVRGLALKRYLQFRAREIVLASWMLIRHQVHGVWVEAATGELSLTLLSATTKLAERARFDYLMA